MIQILKKNKFFPNSINPVFIIIFLFGFYNLSAQQIAGPSGNVYTGIAYTYQIQWSPVNSPSWSVSGGTIAPGATNTASITWNQIGINNKVWVSFNDGNNSYNLELTEVVTNPPPPNPSNPTIATNGCGQATIQRTGTPPTNVTWYWQGKSSNGFFTNKGSGSTAPVNEGNGTYYIRARKNSGEWSLSSGSVPVTIANLSPGAINISGSQSTTICPGDSPPSISSTAPAGGIDGTYDYQWEYSSFDSASWVPIPGSNNVGYTPQGTLSASRSYRRKITCGNQTQITAHVDVIVETPAKPVLANNSTTEMCTGDRAYFYVTNPLGSPIQYRWYNPSGTHVGTGSSWNVLPQNVIGPRTYTVRAYNTQSQCLSAATDATVDIFDIPDAPGLSTVTQPSCSNANPTGQFSIQNFNPASSHVYTISSTGGGTASRNGAIVTATEGSYTVTLTINDCESPPSEVRMVDAPPPSAPSPPVLVGGSIQDATCNNPTGSFQIADYNTSTYDYDLDGASQGGGNTITAPPGTYYITRSLKPNGCPSSTLAVTIGNPNPATPTAPTLVLDEQPVCATEKGSFIIQGFNSTAYSYDINPSVGILGPDINGRVQAPAGNYTVTRRVGNCTSDDSNIIPIIAPSNSCVEPCSLTGFSPANPEFLPSADMVPIIFTGELNCDLNVTQKPDWITYQIVSNSEIRLLSTENTGAERTDVVHIIQDGGVLQPLVIPVKQQAGANFAGNPDDPTIVGDGCGDAVLQRIPDAQLPDGETWYWQGNNPIGTSTLLGSGETFTIENFSVDDNYYIRAYKNGNWSAELGVVYVPYKALPEVTSVSVIQPNCELATGTIVINMVPNSDSDDFTYSFDNGTTYQASNTKSGVSQGTYTILVNNEGCQTSAQTATVNAPPPGDCGSVFYSGENYVYSRSYQQERSGTPTAFFTEDPAIIQQITYFDGLGRAMQQIGIDHTPSNKDIVSHMEYDDFGRMEKEWLPYAELDAALGTLRPSARANTEGHYAVNKYGNTTNPYSEKLFEPSPLNRIEKQAAPGNVWAMGQDHEIEFDYQGNVASDNVKEYKVVTTPTTTNGVLTYEPSLDLRTSNGGNYDTNVLYKTVTYDENHSSGKNHSTEEFTDKQGRVVLKRTYADVPGQNEAAHDTYYVYDNFGNLTYVLPPKMEGGTAHINELGYQYVYDDRNRLVEKRIPGKDKEYIVYNELDQPIMTQDANQRANGEWLFTKYDAFGRVAYTGKASDGRDRPAVQNDVNAASSDLWVNQGSGQSYGGTTVHYNNGAYPSSTSPVTTLDEILTINYYDNYNFDRAGAPLTATLLGSSPAESSASNVKGLATGSKVKVLDNTASPAQAWITTVTLYDDKARPVYSYSNNSYLGTVDIIQMQLDFVGRTLKSRTSHTRNGITIVTIDNLIYDHVGRLLAQTQCIGDETLGNTCEGSGSGGAPTDLTLTNTIAIDQVATNSIVIQPNATIIPSSILSIDPNATGGSGNGELIVLNSYDELGRLENKKVGGAANTTNVLNSNGLQTVNYNYNVRDWLTGINDNAPYDNDLTIDANDLFAFKIDYENPVASGTPLYNGNISKTHWRTKSENQSLRSYTYSYDALNRITSGIDNTSDDRYSLTGVSYDKNGNIMTLSRKGHTSLNASGVVTGYGDMDVLNYSYENNQMSNKLASVTDSGNATYGFKDVAGTTDFDYDVNGNMIQDLNKGISSQGITYNYLNLPEQVSISGGSISYIYDATGVKLKKTISTGTVTDYAGNYIYENNKLQFFGQPEGYVEPKNVNDYSEGFNYVYNYVDHLGNVRLSYTDANNDGNITTNEIVEENNYYPFGLKHKGYNNNVSSLGNSVAKKFKYNGTELEESLGLNLYEMAIRGYDPAIGRFTGIDPITHYSMSTYTAFDNNPVFWADPSGADATSLINDLWNRSGSGFTQYSNTGNGTFEQTAHASDEDIQNGKAILIAFPDQNPSIPSNQGVAGWLEDTFGDGDGKMQGAGHAGIVIIDGESGNTRYFDFGRYNRPDVSGSRGTDEGAVRSSASYSGLSIPNWDFNKTDSQNVDRIVTALHKSPVFKGYGTIMGSLASGLNYKEMLKYAQELEKKGYHAFGGYGSSTDCNNATYCAKFARGVAEAGGFDWSFYVLTGKQNVDDVNRTNTKGVRKTIDIKD